MIAVKFDSGNRKKKTTTNIKTGDRKIYKITFCILTFPLETFDFILMFLQLLIFNVSWSPTCFSHFLLIICLFIASNHQLDGTAASCFQLTTMFSNWKKIISNCTQATQRMYSIERKPIES